MSSLQEAARELLKLKDGPRDAYYEERKEIAWENLRAAVDERVYSAEEMILALRSLDSALKIVQGLMDIRVMREWREERE